MLTIVLPRSIVDHLTGSLARASRREVGGVLLAEHTGQNHFTVREVTVHGRGTIARFVRQIGEALAGISAFFRKTGHDYSRFNYLGEWHSHPLFPPEPSSTDDLSMREIVQDATVGATFAVLVIVKLDPTGHLIGTAHTYLPDGSKSRSTLEFTGA